MIAGHYGLAAGVKAWEPRLPLWALMLSTFLLDVVFIFLNIAGIEYITPANPGLGNSYGNALIHAYYTHSLIGALLIAAVAGALAAWRWGQRGGVTIAAVVFSHWVLDLVVHRPDLPILPGNAGDLPLLGFGLWKVRAAAITVEALLVLGGTFLYWRAVRTTETPGVTAQLRDRRADIVALTLLASGALILTLDAVGL